MKRASVQDFDELNADFMSELWGDPKLLRVEGGLPRASELLCDSFFDPSADWTQLLIDHSKHDGILQCESPVAPPHISSSSSTAIAHSDSSGAVKQNSSGSLSDQSQAKPQIPQGQKAMGSSTTLPRGIAKPGRGRKAAKFESFQDAADRQKFVSEDYKPSALVSGIVNNIPEDDLEDEKPVGRGRQGSQNPSASALAQRRYHRRQKARKQDSESKLQELTEQMEQLLADKKELEIKNRILMTDLDAWQDHLEAMWGDKRIREIQQELMLQSTVDLMSHASKIQTSIQDALQWTAHEYATVHYENLIQYKRSLYEASLSGTPGSDKAKEEFESLTEEELDLDRKGALSSCIHLGMLGYNKGILKSWKPALPGEAYWANVVDALELSETQIDNILTCYQWMMDMLQRCSEERNEDVLPQLGLEAMSIPKERMHQCPAATALYHSYRAEQTAVMGFYLMTNRALSMYQKGVLDIKAYPWSPEWLPMCNVLWQRRGRYPIEYPEFQDKDLDLPVTPMMSAFEILSQSMPMYGIGSRLQRGIIVCPFLTVLSGKCFPMVSMESCKKHKLIDIFLGRWRKLTCWEWMQKVRLEGCLVENELEEGVHWSESSSCGVFVLDDDGKAVNNVPYLLYTADKSKTGAFSKHPLAQFPSKSSASSASDTITRWHS